MFSKLFQPCFENVFSSFLEILNTAFELKNMVTVFEKTVLENYIRINVSIKIGLNIEILINKNKLCYDTQLA